ncbi:hypothetical protein ACERNI_10880 [Camelimonas sp. ID_303_24]
MMPYILQIPGERSRALRWTVNHPLSSYGNGVLIYRNTSGLLDGRAFRALRDGLGAWIETDKPQRVRAALGLMESETLGAPVNTGPTDAEVAGKLRAWRGKRSRQEAADALGIPVRTLDGIESGRPFRYAKLLMLALGDVDDGK